MRKNTVNVFKAWMDGRSEKKQKSVWTDGKHIYSYQTRILVTTDPDCEVRYRLNMTRESPTTTVQQKGIKYLLDSYSFGYDIDICPDALNQG